MAPDVTDWLAGEVQGVGSGYCLHPLPDLMQMCSTDTAFISVVCQILVGRRDL